MSASDEAQTGEDFQRIRNALETLTDKQMERIVVKALRAGGKIIQEAVAAAAPENDEWPQTENTTMLPQGALKRDISMRVIHAGIKSTALIQPGELTRRVARWVEYGHRMVRGGFSRVRKDGSVSGKGVVGGVVEAHPFIRPAYEAVKREAEAETKRVLVDGVIRKLRGRMQK